MALLNKHYEEFNDMVIGKKTGGIAFEFSSPETKEVFLAGNFNQWNPKANPMKKDRKGTWKATLFLEPGRYEYLFVVDGSWESDPSCSFCVANGFGSKNCVRIVA